MLGVPAGTFLGEHAGWRTSFVVLGVLTLGVLAALLYFVPALPPLQVTRLGLLRDVLRSRQAKVGLAVTCLVVTAHFGTYTYVTQVLPGNVSAPLLVYGVAGLVGNLLAGATTGRQLRGTFLTSAGLIAVATLLLPVAGSWLTVVLLIVWGLAYGAVPVCSMTWFARSAPEAPEAATVLFTSSFQATLSAGALLGGLVVDTVSPSAGFVCGGLVAVLAAVILGSSARPA